MYTVYHSEFLRAPLFRTFWSKILNNNAVHRIVTNAGLIYNFKFDAFWCTSLAQNKVIHRFTVSTFLAKRDYVTFGYICYGKSVCLSVCDVHAPYSGGLLSGIFLHHIVAWPSGNSPTKNHEDSPRGSPPTGALNARGRKKVAIFDQYLAIARKRLKIDGICCDAFDKHWIFFSSMWHLPRLS